MSGTQVSSQQRQAGRRFHRDGRYEARGRRHSGVRRRSRQALLREPGVAAGRRFRFRQRLPGRPVHAARLGVLGPVRHEHHVGRARLGAGPLPDRLRHRGRTRRARRPRRRGQRGVPPRGARSSVPARRHERSSQRARTRHASYRSFATFSDPDGNGWLLQEIKTRLPGRGLSTGRRDADRASARGGGAPWPVRADRSEAPLVGLVRRLHRRARARQDPRRGGQGCRAPHGRRRAE